jgi:heat shock protein HtpX
VGTEPPSSGEPSIIWIGDRCDELLLAVCGWIVGGIEGVHQALALSAPGPNGSAISHETMFRWFGVRLLGPAELPELFNILIDVCNRARLS